MVLQYCNSNIYEELREKGIFNLERIRKYTSDLVKGLVYLHQNQKVHGSVNIFMVFSNFGECKLKHSLTQCINQEKFTFKDDIEGLAMVIFEMAHGIIPLTACTQTLYEKEKMYKDKEMRPKILESILKRLDLKESDIEYQEINDFIRMLLSWDEGCRLISSVCLNHAFLSQGKADS